MSLATRKPQGTATICGKVYKEAGVWHPCKLVHGHEGECCSHEYPWARYEPFGDVCGRCGEPMP